ncbi:MAG: DUF2442 domain-containing protein [Chitinivibrionia bacterium]|nr:DUF2442 domain-containing protein [Chitinivibrionia bacterium]MBI4787214.1 DUF2442 domain-containing protein [Chloroflexota bacterium]
MSEQRIFDAKLYRVSDFEIVADYTLRVKFNDGTERVIDFEPLLRGPVFGPLRDRALFAQVKLEANFGALEWPTGADIDPTILHDWPEHAPSIIERRREQFAVSVIGGGSA